MRYLGSILFLGLIALLVFGAISFRDSPHYHAYRERATGVIDYLRQWVRVKRHNIEISHRWPTSDRPDPEQGVLRRSPPTSLLLVRTKLEEFFPPEFLRTLHEDDWDYMFSLIYQPVDDRQGDFVVKRYLTQEEIEQELIYQYSFPFSYFERIHWSYFWETVLGR